MSFDFISIKIPKLSDKSGNKIMISNMLLLKVQEKLLILFQKFKRGMSLEASNGKTLPAIDVFAFAIRYLKDDVMTECRRKVAGTILDSDILWVLTIPAIWTDAAKQFMREAGKKVCIIINNIYRRINNMQI